LTSPLDRRDVLSGQFLRFLVVGGSGTALNMAVFSACTDLLAIYYVLAAVFAFGCAVTWNYYWNRRWTFRWAGRPGAMRQYVRFLAVALASLCVNVFVLRMLVEGVSWNAKLAQLAGIAAGTLCNFVGNKLWVFSERKREKGDGVRPADPGP